MQNTNKRFTSYDRSLITGLDHAVNRTYSSSDGRFTQVDPLGMAATSSTGPQSLNLYAYTQNDPVNFSELASTDEGRANLQLCAGWFVKGSEVKDFVHRRQTMNLFKKAIPLLFSMSVVLFAAPTSFAQPKGQPTQSYEAVFHVLVGDGGTSGGAKLPADLTAVTRQLNGSFGYTNYRLANTFIGRVGSNGVLEYKGVSDSFAGNAGQGATTFVEFNLGLRSDAQTPAAADALSVRPLRFSARVPVRVPAQNGPTGQSPEAFSYENVGLSVSALELPLGRPTLVGTLTIPRSAGTMFLVVTIRPAAD